MSYIDELRNRKLFGSPAKEKKLYSIPKQSEKRKAQVAAAKEAGGDTAMDKFYEDARKQMTGVCLLCGQKTEKDNNETYRRSIAHLFAKRPKEFPSIKTNLVNFIELCFWNNSCHTNYDQHMITLEDIKYQNEKAWEVIVEKTKILFPLMTNDEKNKVPDILLNELNLKV